MNNKFYQLIYPYRRVVIRTADLDTVMCGYLLGIEPALPLTVVKGLPAAVYLQNPDICCIECGGSGQVQAGNFDHHDPDRSDPPASHQALQFCGISDPVLIRLGCWAADRDCGRTCLWPGGYPNLSNLFSGLRLDHKDQAGTFRAGLDLIRVMHRQVYNPEGPLPWRPEWVPYLIAKDQNQKRLTCDLGKKILFITGSGIQAGYLQTTACGVHGILRSRGCRLSIAAMAPAGDGIGRKYSIAANSFRLDRLSLALHRREPGWGGPSHGTIIGSPFQGSSIQPGELRKLVGQLF